MCGRFSNEAELSEIKLELGVERLESLLEPRPRYNIAPSYGAGHEQPFVVQTRDGERALRLGRWWFIPHFWSKPLKSLPAAFNARAEDGASRPFFRGAFERYRCLVPATGWREFRSEAGKKQPYHFRLEQRLFAFAGVWSSWISPDGEPVQSFAIVTTAPSPQAAAVHERMPLVMPPELYGGWLAGNDRGAVLSEACSRALALPLHVQPTSHRGNDARFEGPEVIAPVSPAPTALPAQQGLFGPDVAPVERRPRARR
jgi:putative SOS response-associated peptidase YedK